ncbi:MAG: hypothetical protein ABI823_06395 [Bryobacteraceae bacterium]
MRLPTSLAFRGFRSAQAATALLTTMALTGPMLRADFSYEQTTQVTGGSIVNTPFAGGRVKEPVIRTVMVKGNRMVHLGKDRATIIDIDAETFTEVNFEKKNYSVLTFAEMKQALDAVAQRMAAAQGQRGPQAAESEFKLSVNDTGASKEVSGVNTSQKILTLTTESPTTDQSGNTHTSGSIFESDMWLAPEIPGYDQVRAFNQRMGEKFGRAFGGASFNFSPGMSRGLSELAKETAKLKGIPVLQTSKMTQTMDGKPVPGFGGMNMPTRGQMGAAAGDSVAGAALGRLGGLGGFGRKKKEEAPAQQAPPEDAPPAGPMMETTTQMTTFSSQPVEASKFEPPAGFKQVESEMKKMMR